MARKQKGSTMPGSGVTIEPLPLMRQLETDIGWLAKMTDPIIGLLEIDVTEARRRIQAQAATTGERLSFTAYIVHCVAQAVDAYKQVHAIRDWRGRSHIFDEVDVITMVEIEADGRKTPVGRIIRAANHKTLRQLHDEIRGVQKAQAASGAAQYVRVLARIPRFIRRPLMYVLVKTPRWAKRARGTVVVTAVGMFSKGAGWGVALPSHSLVVMVGAVAEKPWVVNGEIVIREILHLTLSFDHAVVDGAPAARFAAFVSELIESAAGLPETAGEERAMPAGS